MENAWTIEVDRLRADNARLTAELETCRARCDIMATWLQIQIQKIREAKAGKGTG